MGSDTMKCGVCEAIMDEMAYGIAQVDPKKTIQTGNFRIAPDGGLVKQKHTQYARSETHLTEIMEDMCSKFKDYAGTPEQTSPFFKMAPKILFWDVFCAHAPKVPKVLGAKHVSNPGSVIKRVLPPFYVCDFVYD